MGGEPDTFVRLKKRDFFVYGRVAWAVMCLVLGVRGNNNS